VAKLLRIDRCADCTYCQFNFSRNEYCCDHPGRFGSYYVLEDVTKETGIHVFEHIDHLCPLEEAK
jgi:hypothetical protein